MALPPFDSGPAERPPVLLAVDSQEWSLRSVESVVGPRGFAFVRAYTGRQALDLLPQVRPDTIIVASRLVDMSVADFVLAARQLAVPGHSATPVTVIASGPESRSDHIALLEAGAWSVFPQPLDADLLSAQLGAFVRAHRDAMRSREGALIDTETGLYDASGLRRRSREVAADAYRENRAVSVLVISLPNSLDSAGFVAAGRRFKDVLRQGDVLARIGPRQFAAVLVGTPGSTPDDVPHRIRGALEESSGTFGLSTVPAYREGFRPIEEMVAEAAARSTKALAAA